MSGTTVDTIAELLEGAAEEAENSEVRYKVNSARQMLDVIRHRDGGLEETVTETVEDEELLERLRGLGYLE